MEAIVALHASVLLMTLAWHRACLRLGAMGEWHHFYIGIALYVLAPDAYKPIGALVILDETVQHVVQLWKPSYRSPLHVLAHRLDLI